MRNIGMLVGGLLLCVIGVAIMLMEPWGENSMTGGIVFVIIGIVFIATSRTSKKLL